MVEGKIGPIELDHTELYDDNNININGEESFTIICTNTQARQLMGLAAYNSSNELAGNMHVASTDNPWGLVWMDTSYGLRDNEDILHRGWYLIVSAEPTTDLGSEKVHLTITAYKISPHENEYLEMNYTPGVNDGTRLDNSYGLETEDYLLNETYTSFDTTNTWAAMSSNAMTSPSISSDGSDLIFSGNATSDGTAGQVVTQTRNVYDKPWTMELNMKYTTTPSGTNYAHTMNFCFGPGAKTAPMNYNNTVLLTFDVNRTVPIFNAHLCDSSGNLLKIIGDNATTAKSINWKVVTDSAGFIDIYVDTGSGYVKKYHGGTWISISWQCYMAYQFVNQDSTSATMKSEFLKIYNMEEEITNNIITLPSTTPVTSPDFTRTSSDGLIPCYTNPSEGLYFYQEDASHFYDGSVKAYNSNYVDTTPRLLTWTKDEVLKPDKFHVTNGLIKLTTNTSSTTPIVFSYYSSPGWTDLQYLGTGERIKLIKPLSISPEQHIYQINETKWTINRGKQQVMVEHPSTPLTYLEQDYYEHDGTVLVTPTSTPVSMQTVYHCNTYATSPCTIGFQIIQTAPTNIYSNYIPATEITGLGWYNNSATPGSYNDKAGLANEFMTQTKQSVNVRQL